MSAFDDQIGGNHYKDLAIQPMEYSEKNKLTPLEHTVIKYVTRHRFKGGKQDILKAKHTLDMILDMYYNDGNNVDQNPKWLCHDITPPAPPQPPPPRVIREGIGYVDPSDPNYKKYLPDAPSYTIAKNNGD